MVFDDQTLTEGCAFACEISENFKAVSASDLKLAMLAVIGGVELHSPRLENLRRQIFPRKSSGSRVIFAIAALCELDRVRGERQIPPARVIDIMSHMQVFREELPQDAVVECHGESMLPLALWFASLGARVHFTGGKTLAECASAVAGREIFCEQPDAPFVLDAYHFAFLYKGNISLSSFCRNLARASYHGAVILTTWSFLNSTGPRELKLKQEFLSSGVLRTVIQLPSGLMPRVLPAILQLAPNAGKPADVRLIDAKEWFVLDNGTVEVGYLRPILNLVDRKKSWAVEPNTPVPPVEDVPQAELVLRQCDLRPRKQDAGVNAERFRRLDECAVLIRGQMMPARLPHQSAHSYQEVVLTDIDGTGFIHSASRMVDNAPKLSRQRELALLRKHDILLSGKGSLLSLGSVGIVMESMPNWLPNQTFYLVRAESVDPIWLFYFLRSKTAQDYLKAHTSGTTVPQIKVGDLYSLAVPMPDERQLEEVRSLHAAMLKIAGKIRKLKESHAQMLEQCESVYAGS
ncbi:MAG: restriction endonuclease subunit S [Mailhella sp.]|nr:restriction endonuclease subunit S [Mailhella sp.]